MPGHDSQPTRTRREFVGSSLAAALGLFARFGPSVSAQADNMAGRFVGITPLSQPNAAPLNTLVGSGLDARLFTDLSALAPDSLITANRNFYVRTACPTDARAPAAWSI